MLDELTSAKELMPPGVLGIERRIYASTSIVSYHTNVSVDCIISKNPFIGLLGLSDEFECFRCSRVMQIYPLEILLHNAYGKLRSEYGVGPGYCYALPLCSRFSSPYFGHITGIVYCCWNY